jgi:outer membrane immunogenic protein
MKRLFSISALAAVAAFAFAGAATAADMPVKARPAPLPEPTWTGTYIGINGGYAWGTTNQTAVTNGATTGDFNMQGGLAGVTYGGNWQAGHAVLGFETDLDWANINGSSNAAVCGGAGFTCYTKNTWLSTERIRAGWDWNGWLLYGTAGAAFARTQAGISGCPVAGGVVFCGERWRAGWTAGVGVETMFWRNWSAKLEYLHYDLGNSINFGPIAVVDRGDLVRAGINYHFDLFSWLR